ncbi:helix-turn-helix transcriptional regulator [Streptomyces sp. GESEQ-35]|uniref:helix-turn-helix transcriptional regulator n=1 Tax=Streptomyces sp. GESEQ-35 TaxID=2812657 RepID=UPI001B319B1E|nr:helix-turn-helix transcriptional regulator [Streptomyces sp. GESEQ-35]
MTNRDKSGSQLGDFLRARRAAVAPEEVGLPRGHRRVAGLRREEVAALAGASADYYTRLEQGRERHPSTQMLDALAAALNLDHDEHAHLCRLAGNPAPAAGGAGGRAVHPSLHQLLGQFPSTPAFVIDETQQILAANTLGTALHSGFISSDNFARMIFLDPEGRRFFLDWQRIAAANAGSLRQAWGRPAARGRLEPLIAELCAGSEDFDRLWRGHTVASKTREAKRLTHPHVGELTLTYHSFAVADVDGGHLVVCQAEPGSASEKGLRLLSTPAADRTEGTGAASPDTTPHSAS